MSEDKAIRILLVAEEYLVRVGLQSLVECWSECQVVGETDHEEAVTTLRNLEPELVLFSLTDEDAGLEMVNALAQASESARILVLVGNSPPSLASKVVSLGARGVVSNKKGPEELRRAIHKVHESDEIWLDRASLMTLIADSRRRTDNREHALDVLTEREREVVSFVAKGLTNKEVGERLFISETTVRHHLTTIFNKLELRNRFELIDLLYREGAFSGPNKRIMRV
jgi:DNA-binding NarL/FixJ family response regulator